MCIKAGIHFLKNFPALTRNKTGTASVEALAVGDPAADWLTLRAGVGVSKNPADMWVGLAGVFTDDGGNPAVDSDTDETTPPAGDAMAISSLPQTSHGNTSIRLQYVQWAHVHASASVARLAMPAVCPGGGSAAVDDVLAELAAGADRAAAEDVPNMSISSPAVAVNATWARGVVALCAPTSD